MWTIAAIALLTQPPESAGEVIASDSQQAQLFVEIPNTVAIAGLRRRLRFERNGDRYIAEDDFCVSARGQTFNLSIHDTGGAPAYQLESRTGETVPFQIAVIDLEGGQNQYDVAHGDVVGPLAAPTSCRGASRSTRLRFRVRVSDIPENGTYSARLNVMISGE